MAPTENTNISYTVYTVLNALYYIISALVLSQQPPHNFLHWRPWKAYTDAYDSVSKEWPTTCGKNVQKPPFDSLVEGEGGRGGNVADTKKHEHQLCSGHRSRRTFCYPGLRTTIIVAPSRCHMLPFRVSLEWPHVTVADIQSSDWLLVIIMLI